MQTQVRNCYYHPDRGSVAVCAKCGVGICRECAATDQHGRIVCRQCGNEELRQEHKEYRKRLKESGGRFSSGREFIVPSIIGILIVIVAGVMLFYEGYISQMFRASWSMAFFASFVFAYFLFSIPFCYLELSDLLAPKYDTIYNHVFKCVMKITISIFVGWIVFTYIWIRFIVRKTKSKNHNA